MSETFDQMAFWRDLTPAQAASLQARLADDPEAAAAFRAWRRACAQIGRDVRTSAEPSLLAMFVFSRRPGVLSEEEIARVEGAAKALQDALARHPGLELVARDLEEAADAFDALWEESFGADLPPATNEIREAPGRSASRSADRPTRVRDRRPARRSVQRPAVRWGIRGAILASGIVFVGLLAMLARQEQNTVIVRTGQDEIRMVELADGSTVRLLGGSSLSYVPPDEALPFGRRVHLEGRAFFDIMPGNKGFIVRTDNAQAMVLGTSFGVIANGRMTEVVLAEGRLTLAPREGVDRLVVLEPGQMSRVVGSELPTPPEPVVLSEELAWAGLFIFDATPVEQILKELGTHFDTPLSADSELLGERVTGRFRHEQPLLEILETVAAAIGAKVQSTETGYRLARV